MAEARPTRRAVLGGLAAAALLPAARARAAALAKPIPATGERLPAIGLGTWITFNVGDDPSARAASAEVMRALFEGGGTMVDSSPMYGSSQAVVGDGLRRLGAAARPFAADKVWIGSGARGPGQIEQSRRRWGIERFDLLQVHNLLAWEEHLATLEDMKAGGRLRYVGITTSEGRRHDEFERIMRSRTLDFVQLSYNPVDREAERRLLPLAAERGIAVIANRPFREGALTQRLAREPLPEFAAELDCASWAELILKFIVSHAAVTCVIPATTRVDHMRENLRAMTGPQPDEALRRRIAAQLAGL